jgi:branched-chain amino acid transport system ATP-binding protein
MAVLLEASGITKRFGGPIALNGVNFELEKGRIASIIGPNGAGKTTFFNVLTGFDRADGGHWKFDGVDVSGWPAYRVARQGMVRTFQLTKALAGMTVLDNMLLGAPRQAGERIYLAPLRFHWRVQEAGVRERASALLADFGLIAMQHEFAGTLSGGQRKLLEMARALMSDPRILMLDEPMAGVNPALVQSLLAHVSRLRDAGLTIVFVEHDMDVVMSISDRVVCLAEGKVIAQGSPREIVADPHVIEAYLGHRRARSA